MSPRRGGEADKFGNRYEGAWTVRQLLYILIGNADSILVEGVGELEKGAEFTLTRGAVTEVHQVKRQHATANEWELHVLRSNKVLKHARDHVEAGRHFHFVSLVPARDLDELTDRAAVALRGQRLRPFATVLNTLIDSASFEPALIQLLITLEHAPDRIDDMAIACARRFISVYGVAAADLSTAAAGNASNVAALLMRAYAQAANKGGRAVVLDLIDELLLSGAYGIDGLVDAAER